MNHFEDVTVNVEGVRLFKKGNMVEWMLQIDDEGRGWPGEVLEDQKDGENVYVHLDHKNGEPYRYGPFRGEWLHPEDLRLLS